MELARKSRVEEVTRYSRSSLLARHEGPGLSPSFSRVLRTSRKCGHFGGAFGIEADPAACSDDLSRWSGVTEGGTARETHIQIAFTATYFHLLWIGLGRKGTALSHAVVPSLLRQALSK